MTRARGLFSLAGIVLLLCCAIAEAKPTATPRPKPTARPLGPEAPHLAMSSSPKPVAVDEDVTVTAALRGYVLGADAFCLEPTWDVYARTQSGGLLRLRTKPPDAVQCRDHEFRHTFRFANPGVYGVRLALRSTGSRVRLVEWGVLMVSVEDPSRPEPRPRPTPDDLPVSQQPQEKDERFASVRAACGKQLLSWCGWPAKPRPTPPKGTE